ncbi:hypothetical protein EPN83_01165 [Patescibacteria group bacterium]|nr:MAG: hypothetical protein EPN83_01165 [Patescibacteria group bacterium]
MTAVSSPPLDARSGSDHREYLVRLDNAWQITLSVLNSKRYIDATLARDEGVASSIAREIFSIEGIDSLVIEAGGNIRVDLLKGYSFDDGVGPKVLAVIKRHLGS